MVWCGVSQRWDIEDDGFEWMEKAFMGETPSAQVTSELEHLTWALCGR